MAADRTEVLGIDLEVTGDKQIAALGTTLTQIFSNLATQLIKTESELAKITGNSNKLFKQQIQEVYNQIEKLKDGVKASDLNGFVKQVQDSTKFLNDEKQVLKDINKELEHKAKLSEMISKQQAIIARREDFNKLPVSNPEANKAELEGMLSRGTQANVLSEEELKEEEYTKHRLRTLKSQAKAEENLREENLNKGLAAFDEIKRKEEEYTKQRLSILKSQAKAEENLREENLNKGLAAFDEIKRKEEEYTKQRLSILKSQAKAEENLREENLSKGLAAFDKIKEEELNNQHKINKATIEQNNLNNLGAKYAEDRLGKARIELQTKRDILAYDLKNGLVQSGSAEYLRRRTDILKDEFSLKQRLSVLNEKEDNYNSAMSVHAMKRAIGYSILFAGIAAVSKVTSEMVDNFLKADLSMRTMGAVLDLNEAQSRLLSKTVRNLGETYGGSLAEIDGVALALGRAGVAARDIVPATDIVLRMARLTGDTFETSTNAIISFQQVFGDTTSIERLGDKLAYVANVSRLSTHDIGTFSNYALASAKAVGMTEDAVGGLAAAFSNAGVNASTIGTQIRTFTGILTEQTTDIKNFFNGIGVSQKELATNIQAGGKVSNASLLEFIKILKNVDSVKFNELTGSMDKLTANVLNLMRNNEDNINKFVTDLQTGVEGQLKSTDKILESYQVKIETMWNKILNAGQQGISFIERKLSQGSVSTEIDEIQRRLNTQTSVGTANNLSDTDKKALEDKLKQLYLVQEYQQNDAKMIELTSKLEMAAGEERKRLIREQIDLESRNFTIKETLDEDEKNRAKEIAKIKRDALILDTEQYSEQLSKLEYGTKAYDDMLKKVQSLAKSLETLGDSTSKLSLTPLKGFDLKDIEDAINKTLEAGLTPSQSMLDFLDKRVTEVISKSIKETDDYFNNSRDKLKENIDITTSLFDKIKSGTASYSDFLPLYDREVELKNKSLAIQEQLKTATGETKDSLTAQWEEAKAAHNSFEEAIEKLTGLFNTQESTLDKLNIIRAKDAKAQQNIYDIQLKIFENEAKISGNSNNSKKSEIYKKKYDLLLNTPMVENTPAAGFKRLEELSNIQAKISDLARSEAEKGTKQAQKREELQNKINDAQTKFNDLLDISNGIDRDSKTNLQDKLKIETDLVKVAYDRWQKENDIDEKKKLEVDYYHKLNTAMETNNKIIAKENDEITKRKALNEQIQSDISKAIETEQLRLGIITQANGAEYETLRIKIREAEINKTLGKEELDNLKAQLEQYRVLHKQKKDLYTLSREYQKELEDMDTAGYNAAKAGLSSLESGMMDFFDITSQGWLNWHSLASNVLSSIYKQLLEQLVIKQMVAGIAGGLSSMFSSTPSVNMGSTAGANAAALGIQGTDSMFAAPISPKYNGGYIGYASGGLLTGGSGVRDDLYLGQVNGTQVFAMGGEFITRKDSVNPNTRNTLEYINQTGQVPNGGGSSSANVNVPVSVNIENQTGQNITADMVQSMTKQNSNGDYEKVVNIVLKAAVTDPRVRSILKGK